MQSIYQHCSSGVNVELNQAVVAHNHHSTTLVLVQQFIMGQQFQFQKALST